MSPFLLLVLICAEGEGSSPLEAVTCGQASIYYALDRLDTPVPLEEVQKVLPEGKDSMNSLTELQSALAHFGYPNSAGYDLTPEQLMQISGPAIAATFARGKDGETLEHFVVVEPRGNQILVLDSIHHPQLLSPAEFTEGKIVRVLVPAPDRQLENIVYSGEWGFSILALAFGATAATLAVVWVLKGGIKVPW